MAKQEKYAYSFCVCGREHEFCRFNGEIRKYSYYAESILLEIVCALIEKVTGIYSNRIWIESKS